MPGVTTYHIWSVQSCEVDWESGLIGIHSIVDASLNCGNRSWSSLLLWLSLVPRSNFFVHNEWMEGHTNIGPGIYCRGSFVHTLARNVTGKCTTEVNRLPCSLVRVFYTRTGTNMPMCELAEWHKWSYNYKKHYVHSVEKLFNQAWSRTQKRATVSIIDLPYVVGSHAQTSWLR